jgi:hypothetical protein
VELWFSAIAEKLCTFRYHDLSVNFWIQFGTKSDIVRSHYCLFWKKKVTFWIFNIVFFFKVTFSSLMIVCFRKKSYIFKSQYCLCLKKKLHFQVSIWSLFFF